jgi:hypothetical protein
MHSAQHHHAAVWKTTSFISLLPVRAEKGNLSCVKNVCRFPERLEVREVIQQWLLCKRGKKQYNSGENWTMWCFFTVCAAHRKSLFMSSNKK